MTTFSALQASCCNRLEFQIWCRQPLMAFATQRQTRLASRPACLKHRCSATNGTASKTLSHLDDLTCDLSAFPDCQFFRIEAIIRPWRLKPVVAELAKTGIVAVTATRVEGAGFQGGTKERYSGKAYEQNDLVQKSKLDIVVFRWQVDSVVRTISATAHTGEIGDGKIFVHPVAEVVRIRTGERGEAAQRMAGGMADRTSAS